MAKVTFGPIVSEARNKVGGVVFSRNPHGAYSRTWLIPANPNTSAQAAVRLSMRELSQRWSTALSDEQRAAWRSLGIRYPHIDVFRQKSIRPGLQTYLRSNLALASIGSAPLDDAPAKLSASDPAQVTASALSGSPPLITVDCDHPPAINEAVQIWVTPQLSTGRSYFYKYMRLVATFTAGTAGPWDPSAGWSARFTTLAFPSKLGIGIRYVNVETGATGPMRTALITTTEGDSDMLRSNTVHMTQADILALPTAPFTLLPAPGVGKIAMLERLFIQQNGDGTPYTNVDANANGWLDCNGDSETCTISNDSGLGATEFSDFMGGGPAIWDVPIRTNWRDPTYNASYDGAPVTHPGLGTMSNQPLIFKVDNHAAGNFVIGPAADHWDITVFYVLIDG